MDLRCQGGDHFFDHNPLKYLKQTTPKSPKLTRNAPGVTKMESLHRSRARGTPIQGITQCYIIAEVPVPLQFLPPPEKPHLLPTKPTLQHKAPSLPDKELRDVTSSQSPEMVKLDLARRKKKQQKRENGRTEKRDRGERDC
ncbi:hypothetical protein TNCV_1358861 [Trichonephila clavipes]|uniref:Uncharacterized protein n=1 Tax=Trichonephila clavipes TaxID=2585209 RepID=A0A8X6V860_TRICX|nr:hypothetical protein TNCV_1358861 [Trichonephila clavipes]